VEENLRTLERDLREHLYQPQALLRAWMPKADGGRRALAIPTVRDRVAQGAAALVITPVLDPEFESASFGFRRHRSVPHAVAQIRRYRDEGYRWLVEADIENFFDEVDHGRMVARLERSIPDPELLANLYLDDFDEVLVRRGLRLVRFADDFVILCKERPQAEAALELTEGALAELQLALDPAKTHVTSFDRGFRYLGHLFLRGLVLPSPNRLQRPDPDATEEPRPLSPTPAPPATKLPRRRRVEAVTPTIATALGRALSDALSAAGRESLIVAVPGEPAPPVAAPAEALPPSQPADARVASPARATSGSPAALPAPVPPEAAVPTPAAVVTSDDVEPDAEASPRAPRTVSAFRRTLYIQEQGAVLARQEDRLVVKKGEDVLLAVPADGPDLVRRRVADAGGAVGALVADHPIVYDAGR
jgi:hypothetical protein